MHLKEIWDWPDVSKQLSADFEEVYFMGSWESHCIDRYMARFSQTSFHFQNYLVNWQRGKSLTQKTYTVF